MHTVNLHRGLPGSWGTLPHAKMRLASSPCRLVKPMSNQEIFDPTHETVNRTFDHKFWEERMRALNSSMPISIP